jgi:hypothetical protein
MLLPEGSLLCYDGEWRFNARSGRGSLTLITTDVNVVYYEGWWLDNMRHGYGVQLESDGRQWAGIWAANSKTKLGAYIITPKQSDTSNHQSIESIYPPGSYGMK